MKLVELKKAGLTAVVDMEEGMNVLSLKKDSVECLICDLDRKAQGGTYAIPILFPTPNRTEYNFFVFEKKHVNTVMHGYVRHEEFSLIEQREDSVVGEVHIQNTPLCPYDITLTVKIALTDDSLRWSFFLENLSKDRFPYSLALHPFFDKKVFTSLVSDLEEVMISDEKLLPTGKTEIDSTFSSPKSIAEINLDSVFLSSKTITSTLIGEDFSLQIKGSEDFKHVVIFTSPDRPFICVEPQTGSTNAVKLSQKGFEKEANLLVLEPEEKKELSIEFKFI